MKAFLLATMSVLVAATIDCQQAPTGIECYKDDALKTLNEEMVAADMRFNQIMLNGHNFYRRKHHVPMMKLNMNLINGAQIWANTMKARNSMFHSTSAQRGGAGENLYAAWGMPVNNNKGVVAWYSEIKDYNFGRPGFSGATGHFTQVVWAKSVWLGCGWNGPFVCCRYYPAGNMMGQFGSMVKRA